MGHMSSPVLSFSIYAMGVLDRHISEVPFTRVTCPCEHQDSLLFSHSQHGCCWLMTITQAKGELLSQQKEQESGEEEEDGAGGGAAWGSP